MQIQLEFGSGANILSLSFVFFNISNVFANAIVTSKPVRKPHHANVNYAQMSVSFHVPRVHHVHYGNYRTFVSEFSLFQRMRLSNKF